MSSASNFLTDPFVTRPLLRLQNEFEVRSFSAQEIESAGFGGVILAGSTPDAALAHECRAQSLSVWLDVSTLPAPRDELRQQRLIFDDLQPRFEIGGPALDTLQSQSAAVAIELLEALGKPLTGVIFDPAPYNGSTPNPPFPWSHPLLQELGAKYGEDFPKQLSKLVSSGEDAALFRQQFWDMVYRAREENFLSPLRRWCETRELEFCARDFRTEYHALALAAKLRARLDSAAVALENKTAFPAALGETQNDFRELNRLLHAGAFVFERAPSPKNNSAPDILRNEIIARHAALFADSKPAAKIGVLFPARSCQTHYHPQGHRFTRWVGDDLQSITDLLNDLHFDWLFVQEDQIVAAAQDASTLRVGARERELEFIIVPSVTALSWATWEKLEAFAESGGKVACLGLLPQWSERGRDRELELHIGKVTRSVVADLYEAYAALDDQTELPPTIGYPIFREYHSGGRLCCYQPRLNADVDDARLRVRQILHESITPDFETLAPDICYSHRIKNESSLFFVSNEGAQKQNINARLYPTQNGAPIEWDAASATEKPFFVFMPYPPDEGGGIGLIFDLAPAQSRCIAIENLLLENQKFSERATFEIESFDGALACGYMMQSGVPKIALRRAGRIEWFSGAPVVLPPPILLDTEEWNEAAFAGGREYSQRQAVAADWKNCRVFLEIAAPEFAVQCLVNGNETPLQIAPPFRCDVSAFLEFGKDNGIALKVWETGENAAGQSEAPLARLVAYPRVTVKITP
jgi:hypothetical protein